MARHPLRYAALLVALATVWNAPADAQERGVVRAAPPIEPSQLFSLPTGGIVKSMDIDVHGAGVLFGDGSQPMAGLSMGIGDIAQMEVATMSVSSDLEKSNQLASIPSAGLKVQLPLTRYVQGVAASFIRSGTLEQRSVQRLYEAKSGEFHVLATVANYPHPEHATDPTAGFRGLKIRTQVGAKYIDTQMDRPDGSNAADAAFWRPVVGFELWRDNDRARIMGELNWIAGLGEQTLTDPGEYLYGGTIDPIRCVTGGVRFFFSKHVTFDIGIRHQSNYDGLAESAITSRLNFSLPTHVWRDRVIGN